MRFLLLSLGALICLTLTAEHWARAAEKDDDLKQLQGTWSIISAQFRGKEEKERVGEKWIFEGDKLTIKNAKADLKARIRLDSSKTPKTMDFLAIDIKEGGATLAIYSIDGGVLKICGDKWPKPRRPSDFGTKPDTGLFFAFLKREK